MASVLPFAAVMAGEHAVQVATLPYDVMNRAEAAAMAAGNPLSFLHVTRSEIDLPEGLGPYDDAVYAQAAKAWRALREGTLGQDEVESYYVYSLVRNGLRQTGVVATPTVDDYDRDLIRKHERTRKEKEDDRTRHISTLRAQTGPVFLTYRDSSAINAIVSRAMSGPALFDFTAEDGIRHSGWRVPAADTAGLRQAFAQVPLLYIADGHHRAASASRARASLAAAGAPGESDRFLAVIFPAGQLHILPYNRLVLDLNGLTPPAFRAALADIAAVRPVSSGTPNRPGTVCMFLESQWWEMVFAADPTASPLDALDVSILQDRVLQPLLGIDDPRTSHRIDFVGGIRGLGELERRVGQGEAAVAFSMFPTTVAQLMAIADAGQIMPPKSTWFEPKLRDGLFVHEI